MASQGNRRSRDERFKFDGSNSNKQQSCFFISLASLLCVSLEKKRPLTRPKAKQRRRLFLRLPASVQSKSRIFWGSALCYEQLETLVLSTAQTKQSLQTSVACNISHTHTHRGSEPFSYSFGNRIGPQTLDQKKCCGALRFRGFSCGHCKHFAQFKKFTLTRPGCSEPFSRACRT